MTKHLRTIPSKGKGLRGLFSSGAGNKLGTFGGVFTPDVLTILGVIMYLRLGWVVGNAGLLGTFAIIILAKVITICTGLSMSSITTNIRIGAGGAYSIITKSLGLEAGGSVGIPFYVSQTLSAALYIVGFSEGWLRFFPEHDPMLVSGISWVILLGISYISAAFAIKVQYFVLVIIVLSLFSFMSTPAEPVAQITLVGHFEDAGFWHVFAIFFPAVTGIMAGANLSGDLKDPRKSIPMGTMSAIFTTMLIYLGLAALAAWYVPMDQLRHNQMVMVDYARFEILVVWGILAATFSSALGSMVGAPRILQALAEHKTIPFYRVFAKKTADNEPRNAIIFTGLVILLTLFVGSLDALATLITMFFLITYGMLNLVVFIHQSMKVISFRPTFRIPRFISFTGAFGCLAVMLLINPVFSVVALVIIIGLYVWLTRRGLNAPENEAGGDLRGGLLLAVAEKASQLSSRFPKSQIAWKPDLLIPVSNPAKWAGSLLLIRNIVYPSGSIFTFTVSEESSQEGVGEALKKLVEPLGRQGVLVNSAVIDDSEFLHGARNVIQTLHGGSFRPNTLFLNLGDSSERDDQIRTLIEHGARHDLGTILLRQHPRIAFGLQKEVNLWLRDKSPNWQLGMLIALQLQSNWGGVIKVVTVADYPGEKKRLHHFLETLADQARLPSTTEFHVLDGPFNESLQHGPRADINILGIAIPAPLGFMRKAVEITNSSCLFVRDSGKENALV
ncbi:MAG: amino acid permease [Calditrichaeota bacterium]|nr:amino acid permease [Calditrichota bacterium]